MYIYVDGFMVSLFLVFLLIFWIWLVRLYKKFIVFRGYQYKISSYEQKYLLSEFQDELKKEGIFTGDLDLFSKTVILDKQSE